MRKTNKKIKLKINNLRIIFLLSGFMLIICFTLGLKATASNLSNIENRDGHSAYLEVIVKRGDSLWKLTDFYYQGDEDIRKIIYRIKKINNLESVKIIPGQLIKIPRT